MRLNAFHLSGQCCSPGRRPGNRPAKKRVPLVLQDLRVLRPTEDAAVVIYGVIARRVGAPAYSAMLSSAYVRRFDGWKLTFHQQTPR